jgi:ABC-2 type transport system ATP-binding protein
MMAEQRHAIEVRALTKRYKSGVTANDAIDLDVPAGSVFGLLGPNGAGKTTLVRQLTGELLPTSGSISVLGIDVLREPLRAKSAMGIVPQEANLFDVVTTEQHLRIFGRFHGLSHADCRRRAQALLASLDLVAHRDKLAWDLSGGLKRKLLVGLAMVANPPLLVLDEPTTGLDPRSRREVWALIASIRAQGATVLITTHYMDEAEALCNEVAIIGGGRILARGSIEDVRALCRNRYKATYEHNGSRLELFGETHQAVLGEIESLGVAEYSIGKTSLEDVYLELTGEQLAEAATGANGGRRWQ